jgi:hypothetical protein
VQFARWRVAIVPRNLGFPPAVIVCRQLAGTCSDVKTMFLKKKGRSVLPFSANCVVGWLAGVAYHHAHACTATHWIRDIRSIVPHLGEGPAVYSSAAAGGRRSCKFIYLCNHVSNSGLHLGCLNVFSQLGGGAGGGVLWWSSFHVSSPSASCLVWPACLSAC